MTLSTCYNGNKMIFFKQNKTALVLEIPLQANRKWVKAPFWKKYSTCCIRPLSRPHIKLVPIGTIWIYVQFELTPTLKMAFEY